MTQATLTSRQQLFRVLSHIQNSVEFQNIDILTITACRPAHTEEQLADDIQAYFKRLSPTRKAQILEFAREQIAS